MLAMVMMEEDSGADNDGYDEIICEGDDTEESAHGHGDGVIMSMMTTLVIMAMTTTVVMMVMLMKRRGRMV